ncbi:NAD(P)-dependent alcohol dehydrogenase [Pseudonocardia sp. GCM10023141]|uniref:NAD(P)-dependent alcohol dehydrogenase n=1 Tax=Pseudonocardia sp. GCM10023141 TaxID=3252653 RepID=UPI00361824D4
MKAIVRTEYGPPDVVSLVDVDVPVPGAGEVLVRVRAASVDRGAVHLMTGTPHLIRLFGFGLRAPRFAGLGGDLAGVVEAVGGDAREAGFAVGDEVFGIGRGAFAEYAVAPVAKLAPKPAGLGFEAAAAIAISGITALRGLRDVGRLRSGQHVLVIGASGGVGTYAVQLARALGADVTGVCGPAKADLVRSLGASEVIDHTRQEITDAGRRYDLVLDLAGNRPLSLLRRVLTPRGTLVLGGGEDGGAVLGGMGRQLRAALLAPFVGQRLTSLFPAEKAADMREVARFVAEGTVTPVVDRTFTLPEVPDALRYVQEGRSRGKVVVTI